MRDCFPRERYRQFILRAAVLKGGRKEMQFKTEVVEGLSPEQLCQSALYSNSPFLLAYWNLPQNKTMYKEMKITALGELKNGECCHHKIKYFLCCVRENKVHPSHWFPAPNNKVSLLYNKVISCGQRSHLVLHSGERPEKRNCIYHSEGITCKFAG